MREIQAIPMVYTSYNMNRKYVRGTFSTPKAAYHRLSKSGRLENEIAKRCKATLTNAILIFNRAII